MKDLIKKAKQLLKKADEYGEILLSQGQHLHTQTDALSEQAHWSEFDQAKDEDFTGYAYFIITDNGFIEGIDTAEELAEYL